MSVLEASGDEVIAYQGKIIEVVNQDMSGDGKTIMFEWARRAPGVRLILVDLDRKTLLLTKEHRYELGTDDYRLPGGKVFDKLSEYNDFLARKADIITPAKAKALDEAEEEAGVKIDSLEHYHTSTCGATVQWDLLYFVSDSWRKSSQKLETGEHIETVEVGFDEAQKLALDGSMSEERSALVLLRYLSEQA